MPEFSTQRIMPYSPDEMFALVADVEKYPEFLPLCESLIVRSRTVEDGCPVIVADMSVGYKAFHETFTSRVRLDKSARRITVVYVDGPFRFLDNVWRFEPHGNAASTVHFHIVYEFKSALLGIVVGRIFDKAFRRFVAAFETQAHKVYGRRPQNDAAWLTRSLRTE